MASLENKLELIRNLLNTSIDVVEEDIRAHNDPQLDLSETKRHPIRDRYDPAVARALRCIFSASLMLRALSDVDGFLHDIIFGLNDQTALEIVCRADVANVLGEHPLHVKKIAEKTGINADKLSRYLRALCNIHIFEEIEPQVFKNNELSALLKSEHKRAMVEFCVEDARFASTKAWEALQRPDFKDAVESNKAPYNIAYKTDLNRFKFWEKIRPDLGRRGNAAFAGMNFNPKQLLALYPWNAEKDGALVIDMGGGVGAATLPIINQVSKLKLQVQDLPAVEPQFQQFLKREYPEVHSCNRASFLGHDFFKEQPVKHADIYFLRNIIQCWPDSEAVQILQNVRCAMTSSSKVLICEPVIFPTYRTSTARNNEDVAAAGETIAPQPLPANWGHPFTTRFDLQVLVCLNGKGRTEDEYMTLASKAGLAVTKIWKNIGDCAILECRLKQSDTA